MDVMSNFALSSGKKDQLRDFYNYLHQKVLTAINNLDGSTFRDNLIARHQVDMSSALIPAEAVEDNQEQLVQKKVGTITLLV